MTDRYSNVAIWLHWAIAVLIILNLVLGFVMEGLKPDALRIFGVRIHASTGFTVIALSVVRVVWRLMHKPPKMPESYPGWERMAAHAAHAALYFLMIGMPISGWLILSSNLRRPMRYFWTFEVPPYGPFTAMPFGPEKTAIHDQLVEVHSLGGWMFVALLVLHVGAALKHQFYDKEPELQRMFPGRARNTNRQPAES